MGTKYKYKPMELSSGAHLLGFFSLCRRILVEPGRKFALDAKTSMC